MTLLICNHACPQCGWCNHREKHTEIGNCSGGVVVCELGWVVKCLEVGEEDKMVENKVMGRLG